MTDTKQLRYIRGPTQMLRALALGPVLLLLNVSVQAAVPNLPHRDHWRPDSALVTWSATPGKAPAEDEEFPAIVGVIYDGSIVCTGTLIAANVVLTAKHCVGAGFVTLGPNAEQPAKALRIVETASAGPDVDLALLRLDENTSRTPLGWRTDGTSPAPETARIIGFGHPKKEHAGFRRILELQTRGWGCTRRTRRKYGCEPQYEMVLPRSAGADTCNGDSGGPVLERYEDTWRVVAITSRGVRNSAVPCGDGGVYVRVSPFSRFIQQTLSRWQSKTREKRQR